VEPFSPEFAAFWLTGADAVELGDADVAASPSLSPSQQMALEELAERVTAARSVL
jgi:hypothetical protein